MTVSEVIAKSLVSCFFLTHGVVTIFVPVPNVIAITEFEGSFLIVGSIENDSEFATLKERGVSLSLASLYSGMS